MRRLLLFLPVLFAIGLGIGATGKSEPARQLPREALSSAERDSIADLGFTLYFGDSLHAPDPELAAVLIRRAAEAGHPRAANNLGYILLHGDSSLHNPKEAMRWFAVAAEAGLPTAMSQLGDFYRDGLATDADTLRADSLYEAAAMRGLADARLKLLSLNEKRWRSLSPDSLLALGRRYYVEGLHDLAVNVLSLAARDADALPYDVAAADTPAQATALAILAEAYARGQGVAYNYLRSLGLYLEAALHGDPSAQYIIAETLQMNPEILDQFDIAHDSPETDPAFWYRLAERAGITDARQANRRLLPRR